MLRLCVWPVALALGAVGPIGNRAAAQAAELVFVGGKIITVDPRLPEPDALAVRDGMIAAVGTREEVLVLRGPDTRLIELGARALLPGFIDAHGHLINVGEVMRTANLASPPVGSVEDIAGLLQALVRYRAERDLKPGEWLVGVGYDDSLLAEKRHPTRFDLDLLSENPVVLLHVSGHLAVANSRALALAGIDATTPDPRGGVIRRVAGSREPSGVMEESAFYGVYQLLPQPSLEERLDQLDAAQAEYARRGLTTAQDGITSPASLALLHHAAERGRLILDVVAYPAGRNLDLEHGDIAFGDYRNRLKVGGVKLMLDGSPQGKTAYLTEPYHVPPEGQAEGYRGYPAMPQADVDGLVARFLSRGIQILAHANGDAAADQLIHAVATFGASTPLGDHRSVMIHSQVVREDQLDRLKDLGIVPSFFAAHSFYWGDWHRDSVLGAERAYRISPARSALRREIPFTFHNDAPIVPPDVLRLIWAGVNRRTRSGDILGPQQRISVMDAIRAVTVNAARQNFEEDRKGSLEKGKVADLVVLSANPLEVAPEALANIVVEETFSRGRSIYRRTPDAVGG